MKNISTILYISLFVFSISGCGANALNESAEKSASAFYENLKVGNTDEALKNCSPAAFAGDNDEAFWKNFINNNTGLLGKVTSYKKTSRWNINTSTETGTTVLMEYEIQYENGKTLDSLTMIKDNDGVMRIFSYMPIKKQAKYLDGMASAETLCSQYMEFLKDGNYEACYALCGYKGTEASSREDWTSLLAARTTQAGTLSSYELEMQRTYCYIGAEGSAGKGNYYEVYFHTQHANTNLNEIFNLYQPSFDDAIKIISHDWKQ